MKSSDKQKLGSAFKNTNGNPLKNVPTPGSIHQRLTSFKKSSAKPEGASRKKLVKTVLNQNNDVPQVTLIASNEMF